LTDRASAAGALEVLDGVAAGQALVRAQRLGVAEHAGTIGDAAGAGAVGLAAATAREVVIAGAVAGTAQARSDEERGARAGGRAHRRRGDGDGDGGGGDRGRRPHAGAPCRPAPPAKRAAPATPSARARRPWSSSLRRASSRGRSNAW